MTAYCYRITTKQRHFFFRFFPSQSAICIVSYLQSGILHIILVLDTRLTLLDVKPPVIFSGTNLVAKSNKKATYRVYIA